MNLNNLGVVVESALLAVHIDVDAMGATRGVNADMVKIKPRNAPTGSSEPDSPLMDNDIEDWWLIDTI